MDISDFSIFGIAVAALALFVAIAIFRAVRTVPQGEEWTALAR